MRTTWIAAAIGCALAAATALLWQPEPAPAPNLKPFGGDFWAHRVAYPTMHFSPSWYTDAEREDARVASGVPEGEFAEFRTILCQTNPVEPEGTTRTAARPGLETMQTSSLPQFRPANFGDYQPAVSAGACPVALQVR